MSKRISDGDVIGGYTVHIKQDEYPLDPREWDNLGTMTCSHKSYKLGDEQINTGDFNSWADVERWLRKEKGAVLVLPLYLIDHSGISISVGGFRNVDPQGWDWGQVGFIWLSRERMKKEYGNCGQKSMDKAEKVLLAEVNTYDAYIQGDVWYYSLEDEHEEIVGGCGGFYGFDWDHMSNYIMAEIEGLLKAKYPLFPGIAKRVYEEAMQ